VGVSERAQQVAHLGLDVRLSNGVPIESPSPQFGVRMEQPLARVTNVVNLISQSCWKLHAVAAVEIVSLERFQRWIVRIALERLAPVDGVTVAAVFAGGGVELVSDEDFRAPHPNVKRVAADHPNDPVQCRAKPKERNLVVVPRRSDTYSGLPLDCCPDRGVELVSALTRFRNGGERRAVEIDKEAPAVRWAPASVNFKPHNW
jgi:hypothetical protein